MVGLLKLDALEAANSFLFSRDHDFGVFAQVDGRQRDCANSR